MVTTVDGRFLGSEGSRRVGKDTQPVVVLVREERCSCGGGCRIKVDGCRDINRR